MQQPLLNAAGGGGGEAPPSVAAPWPRRRRVQLAVALAAAVLVCVGVAVALGVVFGCASVRGSLVVRGAAVARPPSALAALFAVTQSGWLGGDCISSLWLRRVNATTDAYLWLFGDTLMGTYNASYNGRSPVGWSMPHSTVALVDMALSAASGGASTGRVLSREFVWATSGTTGAPVTLFVPSNASAPYYLWVVQGVSNASAVVLTATQVEPQPGSLLGFVVRGTELLVASTDAAPSSPTQWPVRSVPLDASCAALTWTTALVTASAAGDAVANATDAAALVYVFGQLWTSASDTRTVVMRAPFAALADVAAGRRAARDAFEYYACASTTDAQCVAVPACAGPSAAAASTDGWQRGALPARLRVVAGLPGVSETSVVYSPVLRRWVAAVVDAFTDRVQLWSSSSLLGPYSATLAYVIPSPWGYQTREYFSYAAKLHPELATNGGALPGGGAQLVMSYATNALALGPLFGPNSTDVYVPTFVTLDVTVADGGPC